MIRALLSWIGATREAMSKALPKFNQLLEGVDFYREGQKVVFTSVYHLKRGHCCHSKCRHCPYGLGVAQKFTVEIQGLDCLVCATEPPAGAGQDER